jgi:hypothetical protein
MKDHRAQDVRRRALQSMVDAMAACIVKGLILPCLVLLYTAIDIVAWMNRPKGKEDSTGRDFQDWVSQYMLPETDLGCSPIDLWSARCALLHSYGPESRHTRRGEARQLNYYFASPEKAACLKAQLEQALVAEGITAVPVRTEDLVYAFIQAVERWESSIQEDPQKSQLVNSRSRSMFDARSTIGWPPTSWTPEPEQSSKFD